MSRMGQFLTACAALFGIHSRARAAKDKTPLVSNLAPAAAFTPAIAYGAGLRSGGLSPYDFGISPACRKLVRKNREIQRRTSR